MDQSHGRDWREWARLVSLSAVVSLLKVLLLAPGVYHSTDFEVHRNWLAVTYARPLKEWYREETSEWTLDYPPFFGYFEWMLAQVAVAVEPDLVKITPFYEPSNAAILFQRVSVIVADAALVFGVSAWSRRDRKHHNGDVECVALGALVLLNSGLMMVDHVHFQYNGFLLGVLLLSMGFIRQGKVLLGAAAFASLLMLKHLFLSLAPLYFVFLLRGYCCDMTRVTNASSSSRGSRISNERGGLGETSQGSETHPSQLPGAPSPSRVVGAERSGSARRPEEVSRPRGIGGKPVALFFRRLAALGTVVLVVFGAALGPLCVSEGWTGGACARQLGQLAVRLFPFGRREGKGLVHAYWAPNVWAIYLFADRVLLVALKLAGRVSRVEGTGSTTGGLVRTEVMGVLPAVPAGLCLLLSLAACCPALWRAWRKPSMEAFVWGVVHCSLSAFLVGFHVHEKALLVPAVASALLAFRSRAGARMYLRLSFLAAFAVFPLLPGPELRALKVLLLTAHMVLASSLLQHIFIFPQVSDKARAALDDSVVSTESRADQTPCDDGFPLAKGGRVSRGVRPTPTQLLWTVWDKAYVAGAVCVFLYGEMVHPSIFGLGREWLPFLPLMSMSVYGAVGVLACWCESVMTVLRTV